MRKTLKRRLLLILLSIGLLPYLIFLIYILFLSENKILKKTVNEQFLQINSTTNLIQTHLKSIEKEVKFLSTIDILNDLLAEDLDRRILKLIEKKAVDLGTQLTFYVIDTGYNIVASSDKENISKLFKNATSLKNDDGNFVDDEYIYYYSKIFSSFDKDKILGFMILKYSLRNLKQYLISNATAYSYLQNKQSFLALTDRKMFNINFSKNNGSKFEDEYLIVYNNLPEPLNNWYLVYAVDKNVALAFLHDFIYLILFLFPFLIFGIIYASFKYSKQVVVPIVELNDAINHIVKTQDYSQVLKIDARYEIGRLGFSFNEMIGLTSSVLKELENENRLRLERFIRLVEIFNYIIQAENEETCVSMTIEKISTFTNKEVLFSDNESIENENSIQLYVSDFEHRKKVFFGSLVLEHGRLKDASEKDFYYSIATMLTLQIDRIRLIKKTVSESNAKSSFISGMSHELRTPLNAILGSTQYLLSYNDLSEDNQDMIANIETSAHYLLGMVNNILDIAMIEAGKFKIEKEDIELLGLLEDLYLMIKPLADEKGLEFIFKYSDSMKAKIFNDKKTIQQIIINLLSNAIKFTKVGTIEINVTKSNKKIKISIKDTGIGISANELEHLFQDFSQLNSSLSDISKGSGLGLSLSSKMAKEIGITLKLVSDGLGSGSEAILVLQEV